MNKGTSEQPTYTVINKRDKHKVGKKTTKGQNNDKIEQSNQKEQRQVCHGENETATQISFHATEALYTAVKKKPKDSAVKDKEETPPIPPHTVEQLYTAVKKKPKSSTSENDEAAPPMPPNTVDELYAAIKKGCAAEDEEAPPLPPHTVEELYTAVEKKSKASPITKDKD